MTTMASPDSDLDVNLFKAKNRERPEPFQASSDSQRWTARCMYLDCGWKVEGLLSEGAATTAGQLHHDSTGHVVKLRAVIEFEAGIIRSHVGGR